MTVEDIVVDTFLRSVLETSTKTREQCIGLLDQASNTSISLRDTPPPDIELDLSREQKLLYSRVAQLRGSNRNAALAIRHTKQVTAEARSEIDRLHLQLQNLYYEQRHLRGEISACESYEYALSKVLT